ncbi:hypothetical protein IU821_004000 [Salmonella enterica]|nr:hypothetical protein [Salmonella enterica]
MVGVTVHCPRYQSVQVYCHGQPLKDTTGSPAGTATACFSSLIHTWLAKPSVFHC